MKDSEFIELLNLYLDHEISAADAARLEAEVQSDAKRRRVYQDYCRMQKACGMLADDFATEPAETTDDKIVAFTQARSMQKARNRVQIVAGAFIAAAACLTVVVVGRYRQSSSVVPAPNAIVQNAPSAPTINQTIAAQPAMVAATPVKLTTSANPTPATDAFAFRTDRQPAMLGSAHNDPHFAWIQDIRLSPVQVPQPADQLQLETNLRSQNQTYTSGNKPLPSDVQWTAIRFQR